MVERAPSIDWLARAVGVVPTALGAWGWIVATAAERISFEATVGLFAGFAVCSVRSFAWSGPRPFSEEAKTMAQLPPDRSDGGLSLVGYGLFIVVVATVGAMLVGVGQVDLVSAARGVAAIVALSLLMIVARLVVGYAARRRRQQE